MNKLFSPSRRDIYNQWHKEIYQIDIAHSLKAQAPLNKEIIKQIKIDKNSSGKLLDVACGKGIFLKQLHEKAPNINLYGVDVSIVAVDEASKIVAGSFFEERGEKLHFSKNYFDYVVSSGGLEYYDDALKGAKEIARVLKKNGRAAIFVPNLMFLGYVWLAFKNGTMPTHGGSGGSGKLVYDYNSEHFYTYSGWRDILETAGLHIEKSTQYSYIGSTRFVNRFVLWLYNRFFYKLIPFYLSYSFVYICRKK